MFFQFRSCLFEFIFGAWSTSNQLVKFDLLFSNVIGELGVLFTKSFQRFNSCFVTFARTVQLIGKKFVFLGTQLLLLTSNIERRSKC